MHDAHIPSEISIEILSIDFLSMTILISISIAKTNANPTIIVVIGFIF